MTQFVNKMRKSQPIVNPEIGNMRHTFQNNYTVSVTV